MTHSDQRLRLLHRLAEVAEGEELERVRAAIARRRSELELDVELPSPFTGFADADAPGEDREAAPDRGFVPAPADAIPVVEKRPGERGYRVVGTRRRAPR